MAERLKVTPNNEELFSLVNEAAGGKLALPQFQRSFVWEADDIRDLLVSIFNGYFIGSLLLLEIDSQHPPFSTRAVEGSKLSEMDLSGVANRLLLDGQQRITSLYYAFAAPDIPLKGRSKNPTLFFIDLAKFFDGDTEGAIFFKNKSRCKVEEIETGEWQFENLIVPLSVVFDQVFWATWYTRFQQWFMAKDVNAYSEWLQTGLGSWQSQLNRVWAYRQPVLSLSRIEPDNNRQMEEICTVFEKLNSTGVSLSVFDLLTARLYPKGIRLDELWNRALEDCDSLTKFSADKSDFGVFVLRMIALSRKHDIKGKSLVSLIPDNFVADWEEAIRYLNKAFARITSLQDDGFGVFDPKWLPSKTMLPLLGALLAKRDSLQPERQAFATQVLRWWYWGATFIARYSGPTESISQRDYSQISSYMEREEGAYPELFEAVHDEILKREGEYSILSAGRASNVYYRGIMCLLALNGAKDFRNYENITFSQIEDHHIFPNAFLKSSGVPPQFGLTAIGMRNTIANRTLISAHTNRAIGKKAPSEYLMDASIIQPDKVRCILARHFINGEALQCMRNNDYPRFLKAREKALRDKIQSIFADMPRPSGQHHT